MALAWYVLRSKPNKEEFSWGQLIAHQIEVYYPCIQAKAVSPRAHKIKPYFPGYLFIHIDLQDITPSFLSWLPGSGGLVAFDGKPAAVPEALVAAIYRRLDKINTTAGEASPSRQAEQASAFQGDLPPRYDAIFEDCVSGGQRVHVLFSLLRGRQLPVELTEVEQV